MRLFEKQVQKDTMGETEVVIIGINVVEHGDGTRSKGESVCR